jgi:hypothetical protein
MLQAMKRLWRGWRKLAHGIITVQNTVMLAAVFVFGVGPTAILAWITGRKLLDRAPLADDEQPESHWVPIEAPPADLNTAQRPF